MPKASQAMQAFCCRFCKPRWGNWNCLLSRFSFLVTEKGRYTCRSNCVYRAGARDSDGCPAVVVHAHVGQDSLSARSACHGAPRWPLECLGGNPGVARTERLTFLQLVLYRRYVREGVSVAVCV